ncbi:MAG TPA: class I SAM-dependent methyltransferase, partial [Candidatus Synoicihabitans sp.]|nr:class I SAM-dependent methyltransferase [Candidatus Synoicihabitans sp.]
PTQRFSDRVEAYVRYRPSYPAGVIETLQRHAGLMPTAEVADVGAGTGIFTEQLLPHCQRVFAIEPNDAMRAAAEARFASNPKFVAVRAPAERTTLPDASVDLITAAQAFHWFDRPACRAEFQRILRPGAYVALVWNERQIDTTPFLAGYEALLQRHGLDYHSVNHTNIDETHLGEFFGPDGFATVQFPYAQQFDFAALKGRLLSSSYAPAAGHPGYEPMVESLRELFARQQVGGRVSFLYDTRLHFGQLS